MTRERALELAWDVCLVRNRRSVEKLGLASIVADAILSAVAEEREACAKIATAVIGSPCEYDWNSCANEIAGKIRERGIPLKVGA